MPRRSEADAEDRHVTCPTCAGSGAVPDTGSAIARDLAEPPAPHAPIPPDVRTAQAATAGPQQVNDPSLDTTHRPRQRTCPICSGTGGVPRRRTRRSRRATPAPSAPTLPLDLG